MKAILLLAAGSTKLRKLLIGTEPSYINNQFTIALHLVNMVIGQPEDLNVKVCPTGSVGRQVLDDGLVQRARINVPHIHIFQHQV